MRAPEGVVAKVGSEVITTKDLDGAIESDLVDLDQQVYDIKRQRLQELVSEKLLALEAKEREMSVDELLQVERTRKSQEAFFSELSQKHQIQFYLKPPRYGISIEESPVRGPLDAPVTFIEVTDFECPFCSRVQPVLQRLREKYQNQVRFSFKHFPLPMHGRAKEAHLSALCAEEQGKFWEYRDRLFRYQNDLSLMALVAHANQLGLDIKSFQSCLDEKRYVSRIAEDLEEMIRLGVSGTPTFFINGQRISGAQPYSVFERVIEQELLVTQ
jgi:protein-disulfide isomerase